MKTSSSGSRLKSLFALLLAPLFLAGCAGDPSSLYAEHADLTDVPVKKGACVCRYDNGSETDAEKLNDLGIGWYYNWGATIPSPDIQAEYVPMIWGAGGVNEDNLSYLRTNIENGTYKHLLTFNEPDKDDPGVSSGVSVERALELWPQLERLNVPLSSPSPANYNTGWLDEFMEGAIARGYRVDFITLHCYQDFSDPAAPEQLRAQLTEVYEKYELPIWVTEFAAIDITMWGGGQGKPACTEEAALHYMEESTKVLEELGFVERYAWWIDNTGAPSEQRAKEAQYTFLYEDDDTLSPSGTLYRGIRSQKPLRILTEAFPQATAGKAYDFTLTAGGGTGNYVFELLSASAPLPRGLTLEGDGRIRGKTSETGAFPVSILCTDENGQHTFRAYTLYVT